MPTIDIDFEVFKELTIRRKTEDMTENDVIRELLKLPSKNLATTSENGLEGNDGIPWITKGVKFPHGTQFRATYKGQQYQAIVKNGALELNGKRHTSPSSAAVSITGHPVNGWRFWECLMPGATKWRPISSLR